MTITRSYVVEVVSNVLAADVRCQPEDFLVEGVHLVELASDVALDPLGRRFPRREHILEITRMGTSAVVSATSQWMPWITELFGNVLVVEALSPHLLSEASIRLSRDSYRLHGPYHYSVTTSADWRSRQAPAGYTVENGGAELLQSLAPED